jgi:Tfp pilus assembly protein PilZ
MKNSPDNACLKDSDKRAHPRCPVIVREAKFHHGREVFFGYATNISRSGLFISSTKVRKTGDIYDLEFTLPGVADRRFSCKARVMWSRPYKQDSFLQAGFGLQFVDLPICDADFLGEWVGRINAQAGL